MAEDSSSSTTQAEHPTNDPAPPAPNAPGDAFTRYKQSLIAYTSEWISQYSELQHLTPEMLWSDFTLDFSEIGIHNLDNEQLVQIRDLFTKHGVHVRAQRGLQRRVAIKEVLRSDECPVPQITQGDTGKLEKGQINPNQQDEHTSTFSFHKREPKKKVNEESNSSTPFRSTGIDGLMKAYASDVARKIQWSL